MLEDFGKYELFNFSFSGAVPKVCIVKNNAFYMVKIDEPNEYKCFSEFIACNIASLLNMDCQKVSLGSWEDNLACSIELFNNGTDVIHHYYDINDSSVSSMDTDVRDLPYTLDYIFEVLSHYNNIDIPKDLLISNFIQMCLFDCLIGNYDRHWGNWGFIGTNKNYRICPLFDNGSSLYPKLSDEDIVKITSDKREIYKAIYEFPKSQIRRTKKKKYLYKDLITDLKDRGYESEINKFIDNFESKLEEFESIFNNADFSKIISDVRLKFLHDMILLRFHLLIKDVMRCK